MSSASFRKIGFFGPGRRLAAPEAPKIAGGASLARREKPDSRPSLDERVVRLLGPLLGQEAPCPGWVIFSAAKRRDPHGFLASR